MDCCLFSWANIKFCLVGEGKGSDEVNERFGLCSDLINSCEILRYHFEPWTYGQHGRSAWTVSMDGSVIELIDNNLFHVGLVLNDGLLVYSVSLSYWILTYITYIKKYNIYMVISLLSSWPKLSHRNSVSISSSEFVNHLCKQQWNEYSSSSDSDLFTSISLIFD